MTFAAAADFRVGDVLSRSFSLLSTNIVPFGSICLLLGFPSFLISILATQINAPSDSALGMVLIAASSLFYLLRYAAVGALTYGALQELRNHHPTVGECIGRGFAAMPAVLVVSVIVVGGIFIGSLFLVVPGLILAVLWWIAVPAVVGERKGVFAALGRSAELTKGYRWQVFGLVLVVLLIHVIVILAFVQLAGVFGAIGAPMFAVWIFGALITVFEPVITTVGYHSLCVAKEGPDANQVATVFD